MKSITSILAVLSLSATLALADDKPATPTPAATPDAAAAKPKLDPAEQFKKLDTNGDGKISKEEWMASKHAQKDPAKAEAQFKKLEKADADAATPAAKTDAAPATK